MTPRLIRMIPSMSRIHIPEAFQLGMRERFRRIFSGEILLMAFSKPFGNTVVGKYAPAQIHAMDVSLPRRASPLPKRKKIAAAMSPIPVNTGTAINCRKMIKAIVEAGMDSSKIIMANEKVIVNLISSKKEQISPSNNSGVAWESGSNNRELRVPSIVASFILRPKMVMKKDGIRITSSPTTI